MRPPAFSQALLELRQRREIDAVEVMGVGGTWVQLNGALQLFFGPGPIVIVE